MSIETLEQFYKRLPYGYENLLSVNNAGRGHFNVFLRRSSMKTPFTRRDFYKICLIIGKGKVHYADREVIVDRPALVFSSPDVLSSWEPAPGTQSGWFCLFTPAFVESREYKNTLQDFPLFRNESNNIVFLDDHQVTFFSEMFKNMMGEMSSDYVNKYDLLRSYLHIVLHEALKIQPAEASEITISAAARLTSAFLELLERQFPIDSHENYLKLKTANDYAVKLAVHTNHLNRSVKEITGKTTTQLISERVLREAYALLKFSDWNIAQIADSLGFDEPAYFANFFKKHTGYAPGISRLAIA